MANTFELIASSTVGSGGVSSIDFTSIPSTYTDLCIKVSVRTAYASYEDFLKMTFNGAGATNLSAKLLYGSGSAAVSANKTDGWTAAIDGNTATASTFGNAEIYIPNYAGSAYKSFSADSVSETNATASAMGLIAGLWSSTSAITSISLASGNSSTVLQYSTAYLYGVKNA
jgi:hypothetical protein